MGRDGAWDLLWCVITGDGVGAAAGAEDAVLGVGIDFAPVEMEVVDDVVPGEGDSEGDRQRREPRRHVGVRGGDRLIAVAVDRLRERAVGIDGEDRPALGVLIGLGRVSVGVDDLVVQQAAPWIPGRGIDLVVEVLRVGGEERAEIARRGLIVPGGRCPARFERRMGWWLLNRL
jgi:hypothetical protein